MIDREILEAQKELLAHTFSQAQAYTNVILVAGYAGFFAIWSFIKPELTKATVFWSGLLISLSLGLLPVSQTPRLGVMMKPEVVHGNEKVIQPRVQA